MNNAKAEPAKEPRIAVANFDAVEQTRIWLELGPEEATRTMVAGLRTALLLADTVVVDRNQVLEGIFFISMGPDRLAWHLGLAPGAPLPLTVGLLAPADTPATMTAPGPWRTATGPMWGVPDEVAEAIELNYQAVAADPLRVSSPLVALTGAYEGASVGEISVNAPQPNRPQWEKTDPGFLPAEAWKHLDGVLARDLIAQGRRAWVDAMKIGRVDIDNWRPAPIDIGRSLERARVDAPEAVDLAEALMHLQERDGLTGACGAHHQWDESAPCPINHVTKRSLLVRWLDGEDVDKLTPSKMPKSLSDRCGHGDRVLAFRWWVAAYYAAICDRDELLMLTLYNVADPTLDAEDDAGYEHQHAREEAWGLRKPDPSRWSVLRDRLPRPSARREGDLGLDGEIVKNLMEFSPSQYAHLRAQRVVDPHEFWLNQNNQPLFDLALAVRDLAGQRLSRTKQLAIGMLRVLALACLALLLALRDADVFPVSGAVWVTVWVILAVVAAFPWGEVAQLLRMSRSRLQVTIRLRDAK